MGGTLALGLLPPLTRKLYATDISKFKSFGVRILSDQMTWQETFDYRGGKLEVGVMVMPQTAVGQCALTNKLHVYRYATYRLTKNGDNYTGTTWDSMYVGYKCTAGTIEKTELWGHESHGVGVKNAAGEAIGHVWMEPNDTGDYKELGMTCRAYGNGDWGLDVVSPVLKYSVECCDNG